MKELFPIVEEYIKIMDAQLDATGDCDEFLRQVGKLSSIRSILLDLYRELHVRGLCEHIEDIEDVDEKRELWTLAKSVSSVNERCYVMNVCRCIHALGSYKRAVVEGKILNGKYLI